MVFSTENRGYVSLKDTGIAIFTRVTGLRNGEALFTARSAAMETEATENARSGHIKTPPILKKLKSVIVSLSFIRPPGLCQLTSVP
jgi:hypothetical protein